MMADTLTITGLHRTIDGVYECDLLGMIDEASDEALTMEEARLVKKISGVRGGEIQDALAAADTDVVLAFALIVLDRNGKRATEQQLVKAKLGQISFVLGPVGDSDGDGDGDPPTTPASLPSTGQPGTAGGAPGSQTSDGPPADAPTPTGHPV